MSKKPSDPYSPRAWDWKYMVALLLGVGAFVLFQSLMNWSWDWFPAALVIYLVVLVVSYTVLCWKEWWL